MERDFQIDWPEIVAEAKRRRKERKITLRRLAAQANMSLPTVLRFEKNERDIQLSSALAILNVLGMVAKNIEGAVLIKRSPGAPFEVRFAPNFGALGHLAVWTGNTREELETLLLRLDADPERRERAIADTLRAGWGTIGKLSVRPKLLREIWPEQFSRSDGESPRP